MDKGAGVTLQAAGIRAALCSWCDNDKLLFDGQELWHQGIVVRVAGGGQIKLVTLKPVALT